MSIIIKKHDSLAYFIAENICVPHAFTTRLGGVSRDYLHSLNLGAHRGDSPENVAKNHFSLGRALGYNPAQLVLANQVHGDTVRVVSQEDARNSLSHRDYPECDALVTNVPGVALMVYTADCTPILIWDSENGAVGAVHAGWRGTAKGIVQKTVATMVAAFGCRPENLRAAIGPNIGPCCFETDRDVPEAMRLALGDEALPFIQSRGEKFHVDLKGLNALWLRHSGVTNLEISTHCTACAPDLFWSHRVTSGKRGSQGAVILCKGGK